MVWVGKKTRYHLVQRPWYVVWVDDELFRYHKAKRPRTVEDGKLFKCSPSVRGRGDTASCSDPGQLRDCDYRMSVNC